MIDPRLNYEFVLNKLFKRCSMNPHFTFFKGTVSVI